MHLKKNIKIGEFLCRHFNTEDGRKYATFWHVILYYFKKVKNATETHTHTKICTVYGEGAETHQMCQKWFVKFPAGDFSLDNAPWSGRPVEVDISQIRTQN